MKKILSLIAAISVTFTSATIAQDKDWRVRSKVNLNVPITKQLDFKVSHQQTFDASKGFRRRAHTTGLRLGYELTKRTDIGGGVTFLKSARSNFSNTKYFAFVRYETRLGDYFKWRNGVQLETFAQPTSRAKHRIVLSTKIGLRKRLDFLNLSPSASYALYYNLGGRPIQYYNEKKRPEIMQSPDGFHRGRFQFNLNSKISKQFSVSVYYLNQHEFNLFSGDYRKLNIERPNGRLSRRFNNFHAAGVTLNVTIGRDGHKPLF